LRSGELRTQQLNYSYPVSTGFDEYATIPGHVKTNDFATIPLVAELMENDESYSSFKQFIFFSNWVDSLTLGLGQKSASPASYISIFNNFRGDYEDFN
jgi:hypothetical protein